VSLTCIVLDSECCVTNVLPDVEFNPRCARPVLVLYGICQPCWA
jgi:hypothetical protein